MTTLKQQHTTRQRLNTLCTSAIQQQVVRGVIQPSQLRQRRKHLLKAVRKRLPGTSQLAPEKILHSAMMVLALWGFSCFATPNTAYAAAIFEHSVLNGFDVGSRSKPTFVDIDNDGDLDVFVGENNGIVKFYQNNGTASTPHFTAADGVNIVNPLDGADVGLQSAPTFADIDGDGDMDAFIGESTGTVKFYQNNGSASSANFIAADGITVINPLAGVAVGNEAIPTLVDIDHDGDLDAFVSALSGTVNFYQNDGTAYAANFVAADGVTIINPLAAFDVGLRSAAAFVDIDNDGDLDAFIGESPGALNFYQNNGTAYAPNFVAADGVTVINPLNNFNAGSSVSPTFADLDNDGDLDVYVGESRGTIRLYQNTGSATAANFVADPGNPLTNLSIISNSAPTFADIDNDGDVDAFIGDGNGMVMFYQNDGSSSFVAADNITIYNPLSGFDVGNRAVPALVDIDNDGDLDTFVGEEYGTLKFYQNDGTVSVPGFTASDGITVINPMATFDVGYNATPTFADIDNDGDMDLFVGEITGLVKFYRNDGTTYAPNFVPADGMSIINPMAAFDVGSFAAPTFADTDHDGDLDLFVGEYGGTIKFYQNNGTASAPSFIAADGITVINPLDGFGAGSITTPTFTDIDNDGDVDAFIGGQEGKIRFIENQEFPLADSSSSSNSGSSSSGSGSGGGGTLGFALLLPLLIPAVWRRRLTY